MLFSPLDLQLNLSNSLGVHHFEHTLQNCDYPLKFCRIQRSRLQNPLLYELHPLAQALEINVTTPKNQIDKYDTITNMKNFAIKAPPFLQ
jgi:hypothetical protein